LNISELARARRAPSKELDQLQDEEETLGEKFVRLPEDKKQRMVQLQEILAALPRWPR
jgi:hypothetical protein